MIPNFKVMVRDTVVADVSILNNNEVSVKKYSENPAFQPFCGENQSIDRVYRFLQRRCFNPARPDKMEILSAMGLEEYDPVEIVKQTHGHMFHDFTWILFEGENYTWDDIIYHAEHGVWKNNSSQEYSLENE